MERAASLRKEGGVDARGVEGTIAGGQRGSIEDIVVGGGLDRSQEAGANGVGVRVRAVVRSRRKRREVGKKDVRSVGRGVGPSEAVMALSERGKKDSSGRKEVREPVAEWAGLTLEKGGEHEIGVWAAIKEVGVTGEEDAGARSREGHEGVGGGQERGVAVEVNVSGAGVGGALAGGDGDGRIAALSHGESGVLRVGKHAAGGWELLGQTGKAKVRIVALDLEKGGHVLRDPIAPKAVVVEIGSEMADFGDEAAVRGARMSRVVISLERVTEGDD